jgi:hypothetical protein
MEKVCYLQWIIFIDGGLEKARVFEVIAELLAGAKTSTSIFIMAFTIGFLVWQVVVLDNVPLALGYELMFWKTWQKIPACPHWQ